MDQIREWLYIGKYRETINESLLNGYDISAILLLAEEDGEPLPHFRLWNSLCDYYDEPIPWTELDHS